MPAPLPRGPMPGRVLWLYALATLDREGSVYGYSLSDRVAAKTEGAWRPGPGAIYPALQSLVDRGAARSTKRGARRVYTITPAGRSLLKRIRARMAGAGPGAPDLSQIWAEIAGSSDVGEHLLRHLRRHLDGLDQYVARELASGESAPGIRTRALRELEEAARRLRARRPAPRRSRPRPRRP
jgi:DNA-binding PadR family transcriptional regulator